MRRGVAVECTIEREAFDLATVEDDVREDLGIEREVAGEVEVGEVADGDGIGGEDPGGVVDGERAQGGAVLGEEVADGPSGAVDGDIGKVGEMAKVEERKIGWAVWGAVNFDQRWAPCKLKLAIVIRSTYCTDSPLNLAHEVFSTFNTDPILSEHAEMCTFLRLVNFGNALVNIPTCRHKAQKSQN